MKILITSKHEYTSFGEEPEIGRQYYLEDAAVGTTAQNKAFHALVQEYWASGAHSYQAATFDEFRNHIKRALGAGFEAYVYAVIENGKPVIKDAKTFEEIPEEVRKDSDMRKLIRGRLKSWGEYSKKERRECMDRLIKEMDHVGVNTPKYREILSGLGDLWK